MVESRKQVVLMKGIGVSSGIVIGKACLMETGVIEPAHYCYLDASDIEGEIKRFEKASRIQGTSLTASRRRWRRTNGPRIISASSTRT